jgi:hypothetical protein
MLTEEQFNNLCFDLFAGRKPRPQIFVVSPKQMTGIKYMLQTKVIAEWPGYKKYQGPDGKIWFEKKTGHKVWWDWMQGHRSKRRAALNYYLKFGVCADFNFAGELND